MGILKYEKTKKSRGISKLGFGINDKTLPRNFLPITTESIFNDSSYNMKQKLITSFALF